MSIETVQFTKICREDMDLGIGTRQITLQDGSVVTLNQLSLEGLLLPVTRTIIPSAAAATAVLAAMIPARARVAGVTTEVLTTLGASQGLTGYAVGDGEVLDRWGQTATLTAGAQTDQGDFLDGTWPKYATDTDIILSAIDGFFDGSGELEVTVWYFLLRHRGAA